MSRSSISALRSGSRTALPALALAAVLALGGTACAKKQARPARPPIPVTVVAARRAAVPYTIDANGLVTPFKTAAVASQVDGIVRHVYFREGQDVAEGQMLLQIDPRPYQAAFQQAQAALARDRATAANAQREVERYGQLAQNDYVTKEQVDQQRTAAATTQATVSADEAAVATAKFNLDNTTIRAPIAGRTGSLLAREGNLVHASGSAPLVVINQISPILVRFAVPATMLSLIQRYSTQGELPVTALLSAPATPGARDVTADGAAASQSTESTGPPGRADPTAQTPSSDRPGGQPIGLGPSARGTLYFVDNAVDTTTGTVLLKASFANTDKSLWVGQFVSTTLRLFVEPNALIVPSQAVITGQQGTFVYVVDSSGAAQQKRVAVERTAGTVTVIASGINDGDRVITDGQSRLTAGAKVSINGGSSGGAAGAGAGGGARRGRGAGGAGGTGAAGASGAPGAAEAAGAGAAGGAKGGGGRAAPPP